MRKITIGLLLLAGAFTLNGCLNSRLPQEQKLQPMQQSYQGVLPCADCGGVETSLFLDTDGSYILQEIYQASKDGDRAFVEEGAWTRTADRLTLLSRQGEKRFYRPVDKGLQMLDREGEPISSGLNYRLDATDQMLPTTAMPMTGMYIYMADAAVFKDCATGKHFPVRNTLELERAYLKAQPGPGEPVFLMLDGHFSMQPSMEEGMVQKMLIVDGNARFDAARSCP